MHYLISVVWHNLLAYVFLQPLDDIPTKKVIASSISRNAKSRLGSKCPWSDEVGIRLKVGDERNAEIGAAIMGDCGCSGSTTSVDYSLHDLNVRMRTWRDGHDNAE